MKPEAARPLLFEAQEARLAALDALARNLWLGGLTNAEGTLEPRLEALAGLRRALMDGVLPPAADWPWPGPDLVGSLAATMADLELAGYCEGQQELADTVLMSLLFHLDFIVDYQDRGSTAAEARATALAAFAADWQERCDEMDELKEVFGLLPDGGKHTRWDLIRGLLRSEGWQDVMRIRKLLERLPELAAIIRRLGRARQIDMLDEASQATVQVMEQAIAQRPESRTVRVPDLPGETRAIVRSDRIARMLPAESVLLGHPRLRLVWHARRAERTLLCYEDDDRMQEVLFHEALVWRPNPEPQPDKRLEMGPILICVDTSGSMQGGAEAVAKATVLEAVRTAHSQKRACHVFAFGGPDEVVELELAVDAGGIERLMRFLGQAFRGGTDICGPLEKAIAKLEDTRWQLADLLIASDGEFGATGEVAARLDACKADLGLRVQGILIGDRETIGLLEVADNIYWVRDWRRYGNSDVGSPVHSKSLTAMYFPGALRSPENKAGTVSAETASEAVRAALHRGEYKPKDSS
ncbi:MAG: VWA domain-containing protein [Azonexus sp.]|nr:VWA domain-containing protein [Betaproteobacteria bacterium]MBK8919736.1 VWA domain-containing protein [Betaproteobacteria bacterium]MBP6034981.1 VWA domain-containing protein [Azonexus sp.]MBP6905687.1 VWA domain-containing protein [Azonexus sp.]